MIVQAFLRWVETAKTTDRVRAASALGRAFLQSGMDADERHAAIMAMTYLLDDPSPRVRLALAEALADGEDVPHFILMSLAEDQPEIAGTLITRSNALKDSDLVALSEKVGCATRSMIASRLDVAPAVAAAVCESGGLTEITILLENPGARFYPATLNDIANRFGDDHIIRNLLLAHDDLPPTARHVLVERVSAALAGFQLVQELVGPRRLQRITREACESATLAMAGDIAADAIAPLVERLRETGSLTPAFLMHALCSGRIEFFAEAIINLSGVAEKRVRSILSDGRLHAIRALYESAGLGRDISEIFVEATLLWRQTAKAASGTLFDHVSIRLLKAFGRRAKTNDAAEQLMAMVEKMSIAEQRQQARDYAARIAAEAA